MIRYFLVGGALVLGIAATPVPVTLPGDVTVVGLSIGGSDAMAQRASDPRYQPGSGSCRDGAGRRC